MKLNFRFASWVARVPLLQTQNSTRRAERVRPIQFGKRLTQLALLLVLVVTLGPATLAQSFTVLHSFTGTPDGGNPQAGLVLDPAGNLYGTTLYGGTSNKGSVFKLDPSGNLTVLHSFTGPPDGGGPQAGLALDVAGNLYGTTSYGGTGGLNLSPNGVGTVFKLDPSGNLTVLHNFTDSPDGANPQAGVVLDAAGVLYGTTSYGGASDLGTMFELDRLGNLTVLHNFTGNSDGAHPFANLALDLGGNLYGTTLNGGTSDQGTVFRLDSSGKYSVIHRFTGIDGASPWAGLVLDGAGNLYGTTEFGGPSGAGTVFKLDPSGNLTVLHNFTDSPDGAHPQGGLTLDRAGHLFGTTSGGGSNSGTVFRLDSTGTLTILHRTAGPDGIFPQASLVQDAAGNLYGTAEAGGGSDLGTVFKIPPPPWADLAISKFGPPTWPSGVNMIYGLSVHNSGPDAATNVAVSDPLPPGTSFLGVTTSMRGQASCTTPAVGGTGTVHCSLGTLANGASAIITITVKLTAGAGTTVTNTATVVGDAVDINPANNSSSVSTTVSKPLALVTLSNLTQTYDGTPKSAIVTTVPSLLSVIVTYDLSNIPPTNWGSYVVVATVNDPVYQGIALGILTINKAPAALALSNLTQTYDGRAKSATVTATPAGLTGISVTYNGSTVLPTRVGTYTVVASVTNPNYRAVSVRGTLVIAKASATVAANPAGKTYGSPDPALTATTTGFTVSDAASITVIAKRALGENVSTYPITPFAGGAALANYNVIYKAASFTISAATPMFSSLFSSQVIPFGKPSISLSGTIAAASVFPPSGEVVTITINGIALQATIVSNGNFFATFSTLALPASITPYPITYSYAGDGNFASAINVSTTLTVSPCGPAGSGGFSCTGDMITGRDGHSATALNDGTVLIAGGLGSYGAPSSALNTAELYDSTGKFLHATGNMNYPHSNHTATMLDNGMVLVTGGFDSSGTSSLNAELYNPATGLFTLTQDVNRNVTALNTAREQHTATLLRCDCPDDGKVLIVGGYNAGLGVLTGAEFFNPADGTFSRNTQIGGTLNLNTARYGQTATLLNTGLVLVAGGFNLATGELKSAELYDPGSQTFSNTQGRTCPTMLACTLVPSSLNSPRFLHTATLLNDGRVLFTGGAVNAGIQLTGATNSAEFYIPGDGFFVATSDVSKNITTLNTARYSQTATLLSNGMVLIAGGQVDTQGTPTSRAELFDPGTGLFTLTRDANSNLAELNIARQGATATLLNNGSVLIAGGAASTVTPVPNASFLFTTSSAELYQPIALTPANLVSITIMPASQAVAAGGTLHFIASDSDTGSQLSSVTWSSSNSQVATVSNDTTDRGTAVGLQTGTVTISACAGTVCGYGTLTVN